MKIPTGLRHDPQKTCSSTDDASAPPELQGDLEKAAECRIGGSAEEVVDWDDAEDTKNPQNFKSREKWTIIVLVSAITFNQ